MITIQAEPLTRLVAAIFHRAGCSEPDAATVARHLVDSNLTGHDSHGVLRVGRYIGWVREGKINPGGHAVIEADAGGIVMLDGQTGFGQVTGEQAVDIGIERAAGAGMAVVSLRNSSHVGRLGDWAEQAARAGLVSMHFVNTTGIGMLVAPFGGTDARLSANPLSWGAPRVGAPPLIMDISSSTVAEGKIQLALNKGTQLPPDTLIDAAGNPTTDPAAFYGPPRGAILPFGAHKGYGICMFTEIFAGAFTRGRCTHPENADAAKMINNMFSIYLDPEKLGGRANFDAEVERLVAWVKASPPADPALPVQVPGEFEANNRAARLRDGIPLDDNSWSQLTATAELVGLAPAEIETLAA